MDFKEEIVNLFAPFIAIEKDLIETPANPELGDLAVPCFKFAKQLHKSPAQIAQDLVEQFPPNDAFLKIEATGPYINFFINQNLLLGATLNKIFTEQMQYGNQNLGEGKTIVVDYSSPNIAKPFGIAHIRSTVIGNSICKLYEALGYNLVRVNHLGDWGTQFGKLMVAFKSWVMKLS